MQYSYEQSAGIGVLRIRGTLGRDDRDELKGLVLRTILGGDRRVIVDCGKTDRVDWRSLLLLTQGCRAARVTGKEVMYFGPGGRIMCGRRKAAGPPGRRRARLCGGRR